MSVLRVEIFQGKDENWRWRSIAKNGEPIASSGEGYEHRGHTIEMAKVLFPGAPLYIDGTKLDEEA